jgi:hypothetical protein
LALPIPTKLPMHLLSEISDASFPWAQCPDWHFFQGFCVIGWLPQLVKKGLGREGFASGTRIARTVGHRVDL